MTREEALAWAKRQNEVLLCCGAYMSGTGATEVDGISFGDWKCGTCGKEAHGVNFVEIVEFHSPMGNWRPKP